MNIDFDIEPAYGDNDKYIKTKVNSNGNKLNTKKMHHTSVFHQ